MAKQPSKNSDSEMTQLISIMGDVQQSIVDLTASSDNRLQGAEEDIIKLDIAINGNGKDGVEKRVTKLEERRDTIGTTQEVVATMEDYKIHKVTTKEAIELLFEISGDNKAKITLFFGSIIVIPTCTTIIGVIIGLWWGGR